jgi:hypothetical protein
MKKYKQNILQIFVLAILLVSGAFVFAFSGPTSTPLVEDAQGPIKATGVGQYIGEKSFADLINLNGYSLSILGKQDNSILGNASSQFLNVSNSVTVDEGDVFVTSLSGTGTQNVCLNSQHKLVRCSGSGVFIDEEAPISECYPVVYSEVSSDYNSPNYLLAKQLCATKTTKQNCLDHGYAVWNQGRPPSSF